MKLLINQFSTKEWPYLERASFPCFSIGEEQSDSHVIALAWSPPGLARNGRCALGILTSNLLFSIWDTEGDVSVAALWRRMLIVNHALEAYCPAVKPNEANIGLRRQRIRVCAAAWAPSLTWNGPFQEEAEAQPFLLAILNDNFEIVLFEIDRFAHAGATGNLKATVVASCAIDANRPEDPDGCPEQLTWSSWNHEAGSSDNTITCHAARSLSTIRVSVTRNHGGHDSYVCRCVDHKPAPRAFSPWHRHKAQDIQSSNQFLRDQVDDLSNSFATKYDLDVDDVYIRYWGLSFFQEFSVIHISLHPSRMVEYILQAHEESYLLFSHELLKDSSGALEDIVFEWKRNHTVGDTSEKSMKPWIYLLDNLPHCIPDPEAVSELNEGSNDAEADSMDIDPGLDCERLCQQMVYLYVGKAIFHGWTLGPAASALMQWALKRKVALTTEQSQEVQDLRSNASDESMAAIEKYIHSAMEDVRMVQESCQICNEQLWWSGEQMARCSRGHTFGYKNSVHYKIVANIFVDRCSLSLLAIQEPYISKFCEVCGREYLNEHILLRDIKKETSYTRFLTGFFRRFNKCLFCNGNFDG